MKIDEARGIERTIDVDRNEVITEGQFADLYVRYVGRNYALNRAAKSTDPKPIENRRNAGVAARSEPVDGDVVGFGIEDVIRLQCERITASGYRNYRSRFNKLRIQIRIQALEG